jgi:hypothetical protein
LSACASLERQPNTVQNLRQLVHDKLSLKSEHAIARAPQLLIPSRVGAQEPRVIASINLDDQALPGRQEINDETEHRNLATKSYSGFAWSEALPRARLPNLWEPDASDERERRGLKSDCAREPPFAGSRPDEAPTAQDL